MKIQSIVLRGQITGKLWWPVGEEMTKNFTETFVLDGNTPFRREWTGIRDALLHITNDGDLSGVKVTELWGWVKYENGMRTDLKFVHASKEYGDLLSSDCFLA